MKKSILLFLLLTVYIFANTIKEAKTLFDNKQYKDALRIFKEYKNDPEAQYYLGKAYWLGLGVEKNTSKSFEYALDSAKHNFPSGLNLLGISYANGDGTEKNITKAIQYYRKAIDLNNTYAFINLAKIYQFGEGIKKDIPKAIYLYKKAIDNGSKQVYRNIADIYYFDLTDYKKSLEYYLLIDKNDYKENTFRSVPTIIGHMYKAGKGTEKDEMKALMYYIQASELGDTLAMRQVSLFYTYGEIIKKDLNKAIQWLQKALEAGDTNAYVELGDIYRIDMKNYKNAIKYYQLALKDKKIQNKGDVNNFLANTYLDIDDYKNAYKYYLNAVKIKNYQYAYSLLQIIDNYPDMKHHSKEALKWSIKASDLLNNNSDSLYHTQKILYNYYFNHSLFDEAKKFAKKTYTEGNIQMGCSLAFYYGSNLHESNPDIDYKLAYDMATKIINEFPKYKYIRKEDIFACYSTLSSIYEDGIYMPKDINKSITILQESNLSIFNEKIANIYLEKIGNFKKSEIYYKKAYKDQKDPKFLTAVTNYKKNLPNTKEDNSRNITPRVIPVIDNITGMKQLSVGLESQDYYFIATLQKNIHVYDKKTFKLLKILRGFNGFGFEGVVTAMAFDEKKNYLYYTPLNSTSNPNKNNMINVFDIKSGKIVKTIFNPNIDKTTVLSLSGDGAYILAVSSSSWFFNIINTSTNSIQAYKKPLPNINIIQGKIVKKENNHIAYILDNQNTLWGYSIEKQQQVSKEKYMHKIKFTTFNGTSPRIQKIIKKLIPKKKHLNLKETLLNINKILDIKTITKHVNKKSIYAIKYINDNTGIEVFNKSTKETITTINLITTKILRYKLIEDRFIVLVPNDVSQMFICNLQGKAIATLKGYQSLQNSLLSYNSKYLLSAGEDNIIHIWDMKQLENINISKDAYDTSMLKFFNKNFGGNILEMLTEPIDKNFLKYVAKTENLTYIPTEKQYKSYLRLVLLKKETLYPALSLYIQDKDKWILYNKNGFFTSSKKGKNLIKYHINQGLKKEAKIIENEQVFEKFYRPDLIKKILSGEKVDEKIDIRSILLNIQPPKVSIIDSSLKDKKNLKLTYKICDAGSGVSNTSIILNKIIGTLQDSRGFTIKSHTPKNDKCSIYKNTITLKPGKNTITIQAFDKEKIISNSSSEITVKANYKIAKKPNLHFLSLAVSNYRDEALKLKYPVSDVIAVKQAIEQKSKTLFTNIYTYELLDKNATKENLNALFTKISKNISINDVFIMYIAGHGVTSIKDGLFYFLPQDITDTSADGLINHAISVNDIKNQLGKIAANKSLILIDTCDSGSFIEHISRGLEQRMAVERLAHATGRNYIVASSKNQAALEGYKNHGVFTYTVLDAFNKAYFGNDTILTVNALASFIEKEVPKITSEKFHYEQFPQKYLNGNDFPIGEK